MAKQIFPSGGEKEVTPKSGLGYFEVEELQAYVGGYFEFVYLTDGKVMVCNEEAWLYSEPQPNAKATALYGHPIAGTVLVCSREEVD